METKSERFKRIATRRVEETLDKLRLLGNCANRGVYDYSDEEIKKIFSAIDQELRKTKMKFKLNEDRGGFKL
jgi:hypothetical protein